jgi:glycosyltransferase involved in cell wall biosynthesis
MPRESRCHGQTGAPPCTTAAQRPLSVHPEPGGYLAFLGRICPEKRIDRAIAIAKRAGIELKIAAKVDAVDEEYFETEIRTCWMTP